MRINLDLPADVSIAMRRFANGADVETLEEAAVLALREYLISSGDLELDSSLEEKQAIGRDSQ